MLKSLDIKRLKKTLRGQSYLSDHGSHTHRRGGWAHQRTEEFNPQRKLPHSDRKTSDMPQCWWSQCCDMMRFIKLWKLRMRATRWFKRRPRSRQSPESRLKLPCNSSSITPLLWALILKEQQREKASGPDPSLCISTALICFHHVHRCWAKLSRNKLQSDVATMGCLQSKELYSNALF